MAKHRDVRTSIEQPIYSGTADSTLASMFRHILASYGVTNDRFNAILERYIIRANIPKNIKEVSSVRGNLKKELTKTTMSWRDFIKGLRFLGVTKFDLIIRIYDHRDGHHDHVKTIVLDPNEPLSFSGEKDDED